MGRFILSLVLVAVANAQFRDLATTDDGEHLYFSTPLRLKGTEDYDSSKIMRHLEGRFELFRQVRCESFLGYQTNHCQLEKPQVRGDGQVVGYTARGTCSGGSRCIGFVAHSGELVGAALPPGFSLVNGYIRMSPNGRFLAHLGGTSFAPNSGNFLADLLTGTRFELPNRALLGDGTQAISNDGKVLFRGDRDLLLWTPDGTLSPRLSGVPLAARLSADGRIVVYETPIPNGCRLYSYDLANGRETRLADVPIGCSGPLPGGVLTPGLSMSLNQDGSQVLYRAPERVGAPPQLVVQPTAGGAPRILTKDEFGILEAVLAGFGNIAFASTAAGGLLKIDLRAGTVEELTAPTPQIRFMSSVLAPGARVEIAKEGLEGAGRHPALSIDGRTAPLLAEFADSLVYQIPFETEPERPARFLVPSDSAFEQIMEPVIAQGAPGFYFLPESGSSLYPVAAHREFDSLVTPDNPARPGEIVHVYLTGLGRVTPPVPTGEAAPLDSIRRIETAFDCSANVTGSEVPIEVFFAGLAPGFIGVYQLDLRVPEGAPDGDFGFQCRTAVGSGWYYGFASLPVRR